MGLEDVTFRPVRGRRSFEEVAAQIREQISQGNLREGDRLPAERDLATTLGVSRNTVREALRALEHSGVIVLKPGVKGGAFISNGGANAIKTALDDLVRLGSIRPADLIEVRLLIGREAVRLACERYQKSDFEALEANFARTVAATEAGNLPLRVSHSLEMHKLLARASKNPVLVIITDVLLDITMEFVKVIGVMPNDYVVESQRRLLGHLRDRDADKAAGEMDNYLRTTLRTYLTHA
jgi:DNA-binding FadR family transcriptional regulator